MRNVLMPFLLLGSCVLAACVPAPDSPEPTLVEAPPVVASDTPPAPRIDTPAPEVTTSPAIVFRIVPEETEARFLIDEILGGIPKTVVGTTSAVRGEIAGRFASPDAVMIGPIEVDLSTLRTDNTFRNRAIHDVILQTGLEANRTAVFQVSAIEGLPSQVSFGTPYELALSGDLTIHGVTRPVVFEAVVTALSETRLEGTASLALPYGDFDVQILRLPPQVASVGDIVTLEIDFVAEAE